MGGRLQLQDSSRPFEGRGLAIATVSTFMSVTPLWAHLVDGMGFEPGPKALQSGTGRGAGVSPWAGCVFFFVSIYPLHILKHPLSLNYPVHLLSAKWNRGGFSPFLRIFLPLFQGGFSNSAKAVFYRFFMRHIFAENWAVFAETANAVKNRCGFFWRKADEQAN